MLVYNMKMDKSEYLYSCLVSDCNNDESETLIFHEYFVLHSLQFSFDFGFQKNSLHSNYELAYTQNYVTLMLCFKFFLLLFISMIDVIMFNT